MNYEVEQKYWLAETEEFKHRLKSVSAEFLRTIHQADTYYNHPLRDFAQTDEALRIRRTEDENFVTFKGPKIDTTTKTRIELELPLPSGAEGAQQFGALLEALSFRLVTTVKKTRQLYRVKRNGREIEVALDRVEEVGSFVELETTAQSKADLKPARETVAELADELELESNERRSYLELLLENRR